VVGLNATVGAPHARRSDGARLEQTILPTPSEKIMAQIALDPRERQPLANGSGAGSGPVWHTLSVDEALRQQGSDGAQGLSTAEVAARQQQYGPNAFTQAKKVPGWLQFLRQYQDTMQIVLFVAGLISGFVVRQWGAAVVLVLVTIANALLGLRQEGKAEASIAALQKMMIIKAKTRRDGQLVEIPAEQLVPGDVVHLEAGDRVPADGRIIRCASMEVAEAPLTGESVPVAKNVDAIPSADTPLGDRIDMAYMNTEVTRGAGEILVTATGMSTEVGHISGMLQSEAVEKTPLTKQLDVLTNQILVISTVALIASTLLGLSRGVSWEALFITGIAFAIGAIPTGLPAVVTYLLATGAMSLAQAGAIMKRLRSVETLGSTTAVNSDKTGTLTLNQMTAVELVLPGHRFTITGEGYSTSGKITGVGENDPLELSPYLLPMTLAADAAVKRGELVGDPTEGALVVLAAKGGVDAVAAREEYPRLAEVPFDAAYKLMATFHRMTDEDGRDVVRCFVKGAPDQVLARASHALDADQKRVEIASLHDGFEADNVRLGKQGLRVMAVARRDLDPATFDPAGDLLFQVTGLTMLALVGIVDPPRPEVKPAIAKAKSAGIRVRMITGDHAVTAAAIARELGIDGRALTGAEFAAMSDADLERQLDEIGVIARVTPEDKVRLVDLLKRAGHVVAMTGDGVNDAPALKRADIGVAMGITGTDVSKEAAVMVLTDDNFATIIRAVEIGRKLYDNLMKYIRLQMATLFAFVVVFLGAAVFNILQGQPMSAMQVLWVNFTIIVFMAIGLGLGAAAPGIMDRPPRQSGAALLPRGLMTILVVAGIIMAAGALAAAQYALSAGAGDIVARTMALTTFSFAVVFVGLAYNDELGSVFSHDTLENDKLMKMTGWAILTAFLITEVDFMQRLFGTTELSVRDWLICVAAGSVVLWFLEIVKFFQRRAATPAPQPTPELTEALALAGSARGGQ
jgi:P-type Ca2+ transporter type 2C